MKIWEQIKSWASFSEDEKVLMDRRAFMRGMVVTGAGLLVPGVTVFDLGRKSGWSIPDFDIEITDIPDIKAKLISEYIQAERKKLAVGMGKLLLRRRDYAAIGRQTFLVEQLPSGSLPIYGPKDA